jgi:hypothetical protein
MIHKILLVLGLALLASTVNAGVDLAPTPAEYTAEGITIKQLMFRDDERRVSYELPHGWNYRSEGARLVLTPGAKFERAEAVIQASRLEVPQPLDDKAVAAFKQQFLASLPPSSQMIELSSEELNPVRLDGNLSYAITASFQTLGETFVRSTVVINLPDTQLRFQITGRKADFEALNRAFRGSLSTWRWTQPAQQVATATAPPAGSL